MSYVDMAIEEIKAQTTETLNRWARMEERLMDMSDYPEIYQENLNLIDAELARRSQAAKLV